MYKQHLLCMLAAWSAIRGHALVADRSAYSCLFGYMFAISLLTDQNLPISTLLFGLMQSWAPSLLPVPHYSVLYFSCQRKHPRIYRTGCWLIEGHSRPLPKVSWAPCKCVAWRQVESTTLKRSHYLSYELIFVVMGGHFQPRCTTIAQFRHNTNEDVFWETSIA